MKNKIYIGCTKNQLIDYIHEHSGHVSPQPTPTPTPEPEEYENTVIVLANGNEIEKNIRKTIDQTSFDNIDDVSEDNPIVEVRIGSNVSKIDKNTFAGMSNLSSVYIPNSVLVIGENALSGCSSLTEVTLPNSVRKVHAQAFKDCTSLETIQLSEKLTTIDSGTFTNCRSISNIDLPEKLEIIYNDAFLSCTSLQSIVVPETVEKIGNNAFQRCTNLTAVTMVGDCPTIGSNVFENIGSNPIVYINSDTASTYEYDSNEKWQGMTIVINTIIDTRATYIYYNNETTPHKFNFTGELTFNDIPNEGSTLRTNMTAIRIGTNVTSLGYGVLRACSKLHTIIIPDSVKTLNSYALAELNHLRHLDLGHGIETIKQQCFYNTMNTVPYDGTTYLSRINVPDSIKTIEYQAFYYCASITDIWIGTGIETIGKSAFAGCSSATIHFVGKTKPLSNYPGLSANYPWGLTTTADNSRIKFEESWN